MNKGERIDNFESISNESPIVANEKDKGEMVSTSSSSIYSLFHMVLGHLSLLIIEREEKFL